MEAVTSPLAPHAIHETPKSESLSSSITAIFYRVRNEIVDTMIRYSTVVQVISGVTGSALMITAIFQKNFSHVKVATSCLMMAATLYEISSSDKKRQIERAEYKEKSEALIQTLTTFNVFIAKQDLEGALLDSCQNIIFEYRLIDKIKAPYKGCEFSSLDSSISSLERALTRAATFQYTMSIDMLKEEAKRLDDLDDLNEEQEKIIDARDAILDLERSVKRIEPAVTAMIKVFQ